MSGPLRPATRRASILLAAAPLCVAFAHLLAQAPAAPSDLSAFPGEYRWADEPEIVTSVYLESGRLFEAREGKPREPLVRDPGSANNPDRFALRALDSHLTFTRDPHGHINGLRISSDTDPQSGIDERRTGDTPPHLVAFRDYVREDVMIPMRDGVKLHTAILRPRDFKPDKSPALPFLFERTPYGIDDYDSARINNDQPELAASGYLFIFQDIRGRYRSGGAFVMNRPISSHADPNAIDETTDTRDTIDWLLRNIPGNSGRVGVYGTSYPGFLAMLAGIDPHPAIKAISPQAPMTDVWLDDDFFHNGAFRQSYGFDYVQEMEAQKTDVYPDSREDAYEYFLKKGNFAKAAAAAHIADLPTARKFLEQPGYTDFWRSMALEYHLSEPAVPILEVGGFWDQEDMWGPQAEYAALHQHDPQHQVFMVLGPWNHGAWENSTGRSLGPLNFNAATAIEYRKRFEAPFFEHYLKNDDAPGPHPFKLQGVASFRTGSNHWEHYSAWPPHEGFEPARLYLQAGKALTFTPPAPTADAVAATYVSDPADPVPYRHRPIQSTYAPGSRWYTWLVEDQRFVTSRKDVATFETSILDRDVTLTGDVLADLFASTTGTDADWIVKLIDVYPNDAPEPMASYQLMVADDIFRARYLHSFQTPQPLKPGAINEFRWDLHAVDHVFLKGHRIMVEVQSTWFPLYDRNPQTFVPNIMNAPAKAYQPQTITVYSSPEYPSHLDVQVLR